MIKSLFAFFMVGLNFEFVLALPTLYKVVDFNLSSSLDKTINSSPAYLIKISLSDNNGIRNDDYIT